MAKGRADCRRYAINRETVSNLDVELPSEIEDLTEEEESSKLLGVQ